MFSVSLYIQPMVVAVPDKCAADGLRCRFTQVRHHPTTCRAAADSVARETRTASPAESRRRRMWTETASLVSETAEETKIRDNDDDGRGYSRKSVCLKQFFSKREGGGNIFHVLMEGC